MKEEYENEIKDNEKEQSSIQVKLPLLILSKFEHTHFNRKRFWIQFEIEIGWSEILQVGEFSYLKEMSKWKVRTVIDILFYNRRIWEN